MSKVMVLPEHVASQIAAGEVIERPASVVKELVENSIDAGATTIEVDVDSGCLNMRVADNGCGMEADDAVLAFHRHATSKLSSADDLWKLQTMGFRGEALPSIASVSRLTCYTRAAAAETGLKLESVNGTISSARTGCAAGTVIEVNDLFYNVPARLQFLKKAATEFAHIQETLEALAIANLHISFSLLKSGQKVFKTSGSGDLSKAVIETGFLRSADDLHEVRLKSSSDASEMGTGPAGGWDQGVEISGYVARPTNFRGDRKGILTMVNNRPVRCFVTHKALDYVFSDLIPRGRFPVAVLNIKLDPTQVDVNVHPSKKEIRYVHGNEVYAAVQRALVKAVRGSSALVEQMEQQFGAQRTGDMTTTATVAAMRETNLLHTTQTAEAYGMHPLPRGTHRAVDEQQQGSGVLPAGEQLSFSNRLSYAPAAMQQHPEYEADTFAASAPMVAEPGLEASFPPPPDLESSLLIVPGLDGACSASQRIAEGTEFSTTAEAPYVGSSQRLPVQWRLIGYLHNTYFLIESPSGLELIEQHIAHERVLYERLLSIAENQREQVPQSQRLITSLPLKLTPVQLQCLETNMEFFKRLGFDFEFTEENSEERSRSSLEQPNDRAAEKCVRCIEVPIELAYREYAAVLQQLLENLEGTGSAQAPLEIVKSLACQSAVKNGMPLSEKQIIELINQWYTTPCNDTCPHGRPIRLSFSMDQLFRMSHPA